jgi:hypothetical protein
MTLRRTAKGLSEDVQAETARRLRLAVNDTLDLHLADLARATGRDPSVAEDWAKGVKPFPVWVLAHPNVPRSIRAPIIAWLVERLAQDTPSASVEQATTSILAVAGELLSLVAPMLTDGVLDHQERAAMRPIMARLHRLVGAWLAQHGDSVRGDTTRGVS